MTNDTRTTDEIERDIEDERARLSGSINDLQQKFSLDAIMRDIGDMFRGKYGQPGGEIGRTVVDTLGRNPAATALTAVGLAWMVFGPTIGGGDSNRRPRSRRDWAGAQDDVLWSEDPWTDPGALHGDRYHRDGDDDLWHADTSRSARSSLRGRARALGDSVSDMAGGARHRMADLKERLTHGTEGFSEDAKARVAAARKRAIEAREEAEDTLRRGRRAAGDMYDEQPLVVGALAVAVGAAIGGALPRSRMEDETLGASSDHLFAEAEAVFREEREKAKAVMGAAGREARQAAKDVASDMADRVPDADEVKDRLSEAGQRVADEAEAEADRQGMTKPNS